jgi:hypothetical protein
MRPVGFGIVGVGPLVVLCACSSEPSRPPITGGDLDASTTPSREAGVDAGGPSPCKQPADTTCTQLLNCGNWVPVTQVAQPAPTAAGGRVDDGLYYMTKYVIYTGTGGATGNQGASFRETKRFTGSLLELSSESNQDPLTNYTATVGYEDATATTPPKIVYTFDCPNKRTLGSGVTVAADKRSFDVFYQATWVATYTKVD